MATHESMSALPDHEIISRLAVEIMKWDAIGKTEDGLLPFWASGGWNPLRDWNNTMEVVAKITNPFGLQILLLQGGAAEVHYVSGGGDTFREFHVNEKNAQRAICLAALSAVSHP